jgi:predicted DCC family thiol-disulfide oxidoreductase YuxK
MTAEAGIAFEVFFDGECPLCRREIAFLRRLDRRRNAIRFSDIAARGFDPREHGLTLTRDDLMARIHGRTADGHVVEGVEVFRHLYAAVGFGPLVALTRFRPIAALLDAAYRWFAANRLALTGRPGADGECESGACLLREKRASETLPASPCATSCSTASPTSSRENPRVA